MPWQDIHARVEGRAARDIMINFVERSANFLLSYICLNFGAKFCHSSNEFGAKIQE